MPDWQEIVRKHLTSSRLPVVPQSVIDEIAAHLEDHYDELLRQGKSPDAALHIACSALPQGKTFSKELQSALDEGEMNHRVKTFWLPAIGVTAASMILFQLLQLPDVHLQRLASGACLPLFDWRWLPCLPFLGALAAYWSRQSGGTISQRALAAVAPAVAFGGFLILFFLVVSLPWEHRLSVANFFGTWIKALALLLSLWIVLPALCLLLGALPFLRGHSEEHTPVAVAR